MTSTVSFKDKFKQAFSFFQWELKSCAGTLTIYSILTAVFMVIILTMCLVIGMQADSSGMYMGEAAAFSNIIWPELTEIEDCSALTFAKAAFQTLSFNMVQVMTLIFAIIYTVKVFGYLHNKRQTDMYGSMPVSRITLFFSKSATAFIFSVVPAIVFMSIIALISTFLGLPLLSENAIAFVSIIIGSLACISAYGLIAVCCGTTINSILMFIAVSIAYPMSAYLVRGIMDSFYIGLNSDYLDNSFIMKAFCPLSAYDGTNIIYWLIFTIVCLIVSAYLVKNRKAERAQTSFAYYLPCHIVKVLISFIAGMFFGVLFGSLNVFGNGYAGFVFGFILASIPAFIVCHLIFYHGFRKLIKTSVVLGVLIAVTACAMALINLDVTGYNKFVPDIDEIESAGFIDSNHCYYDSDKTNLGVIIKDASGDFNDETRISSAVELHKYILKNMNNTSSSKFANTWTSTLKSVVNLDLSDYKLFSYKMKNGDVVTRKFDLSFVNMSYNYTDDFSDDNELDYEYIDKLTSKLVCTKDYQLKYSAFMNADCDEISSMDIYVSQAGNNNVHQYEYYIDGEVCDKDKKVAEDREKIFEAFKKDFATDTKDFDKALYGIISNNYTYYSYGENSEYAIDSVDCVCVIDISYFSHDMFKSDYEELVVPKSYTNTIQALKDAEILDSEGAPITSGPYYGSTYSEDDF